MQNDDPFKLFAEIYQQVLDLDVAEPNAMNLATAAPDGRPSSRMVLLKGYDDDGFVFYTNLGSRKAAELEKNPYAALCFYWQPLQCQIRIEGAVAPVDDQEADAYFAERPEMSRIGAWASRQSQPLPERSMLLERVEEVRRRFDGETIPRPPFWSGYRVTPDRMEFWFGREYRLHERQLFERDGDGSWRRSMLYP